MFSHLPSNYTKKEKHCQYKEEELPKRFFSLKCKAKCNSRRGKVAFSFTIKQLAIIPAKSDINTTADSRKEKVVIMSVSNSNKHLTLEERKIIEIGIGNDSTQAAIADTLGKNKSTISREIRSHRTLVKRSMFTVDCAKYQSCKPGNFCKGTNCKDFVAFKCKRRDRSPGACNGCSKFSNCRYTKYFYKIKPSPRRLSMSILFPIHVPVRICQLRKHA